MVLLVLTKPKQLLHDQCWEAAGLAQLTGNMPELQSMCCLLLACNPWSHSSCAHGETPCLHEVMFSSWLCWWWLQSHILPSLKLVTLLLPSKTRAKSSWVPVSSPGLSWVFPGYLKESGWISWFAGKEPEKCLTQQWKSLCDYSLRGIKGKECQRRLYRHMGNMAVGRLARLS